MRSEASESGFTLLEILLVIVIVAVAAAMIAPSFFSAAGVSSREGARHLAMTLRLAADETALSGRPLVWYATRHSYGFEKPDGKGKWVRLTEAPFSEQRLPAGLALQGVQPVDAMAEVEDGLPAKGMEPVIARLLLMPAQGVQLPADITIAREGESGRGVRIHLQPGHDGIHLAEETAQ